MLCLQLFTGTEELPHFQNMAPKGQSCVETYLDVAFKAIGPRISANGQGFIRSCLVYDGQARLTAREALRHRWFRESRPGKRFFKRLESASVRSWVPRGITLPVIEDLTGLSVGAEGGDTRVKSEAAAGTASRFWGN